MKHTAITLGKPRQSHAGERLAARTNQRGVTLIGLMVGLLISSIVVLGILILYRTVVHIAVDSSEDARRDADLMSGMLAANMRLQGAGFKVVDAAYGTHLLVIQNAAIKQDGSGLSGTAQSASNGSAPIRGNAVIWSSTDLDGSTLCEALVPTPAQGKQAAIGMSYTYAPGCSGIGNWQSLKWVAPSPIIVKAKVDLSVTTAPCKPFGIEQGPGGIQLTLYALNAVQMAAYSDTHSTHAEPAPLDAIGTGVSKNSICLANFPSHADNTTVKAQ